jgi:outer membrane protein assembly factor BamB
MATKSVAYAVPADGSLNVIPGHPGSIGASLRNSTDGPVYIGFDDDGNIYLVDAHSGKMQWVGSYDR